MISRIAIVLLVTLSFSSFAQNSIQDLKVHQKTPLYEIKLYIGQEEDIAKITNKETGELLQLIDGFKVRGKGYGSHRGFEMEDYNFDGYLDLAIDAKSKSIPKYTASEGNVLPIDGSTEGDKHYWLFNPKTKQYEYNITLSNIPELIIDTKQKRLSSTEYTLYAHCQSSYITYFYTMKGNQVYADGREEGRSNSNPNEPDFPVDNIKELIDEKPLKKKQK